MWISNSIILFRRHVPGRIFSGKHCVTMKTTKFQRNRIKEYKLRVENNEKLLCYPYLTVNEEHYHASIKNKEQKTVFFDLVKKRRNLGKSVLNVSSTNIEGVLEHLNVSKVVT